MGAGLGRAWRAVLGPLSRAKATPPASPSLPPPSLSLFLLSLPVLLPLPLPPPRPLLSVSPLSVCSPTSGLKRRNQIQGLQENVRKLPKLPNLSPLAIKHLWIRTALFERVLDKIVHYLVENSR